MRLINRDWNETYRLITSPLRLEPDFIIAGEAKCGTTSLYRYISAHPEVLLADRKEPNNFIDYPGSMVRCRSHYSLKIVRAWNRAFSGRACVTGEASAEYFSRRHVAKNIARNLQKVKVIILLRDPAERALSDWNMLHQTGALKDSFEDIVDRSIKWLSDQNLRPILEDAGQIEHSSIRVVLRGIYIDSLRHWMKYFDKDRLRVYPSEHLFRDPQGLANSVFEYLNVTPYALTDKNQYREGGYDASRYANVLRKLSDFYAPYNEELFHSLGYKLPWNNPENGLIQTWQ